MPGSLLSGMNHEHLRREKYRTSRSHLLTQITSLWELPINTFKNKAIVLSGRKIAAASPSPLYGRVYENAITYTECDYTLNQQGSRSAWTNRGIDAEVIDIINDRPLRFSQGCDLFPRTALFHTFTEKSNGNWDITPIERTSPLWYLVSENKKECCNDLAANNIDGRYVYSAYISKHLSPFVLSEPAKVLIPGRKEDGEWKTITTEQRAMMNPSTENVFATIEATIEDSLVHYLDEKINIYGKLRMQDFSGGNWLVLSSASGANPCAAYLSLDEIDRDRIIIDQTLYWHLADTEEEAIFLVGLLNSEALAVAINDFQPEGGFGKRHIHTLPYKVMPQYDSENALHVAVVEKTLALVQEWIDKCNHNTTLARKLDPNNGALHGRRRAQQAAIKTLVSYTEYATACSEVLG